MGGLFAGVAVAAAFGVGCGAISAIFSGFAWASFLHGLALGATLPALAGCAFLLMPLMNILSGERVGSAQRELSMACFGAIATAGTAWWNEGGLGRAATAIPNSGQGVLSMETIGLIATGGALYWGLAFIAAVFVSRLADCERPFSATIVALCSALLLCWLGDVSPLQWIREHPVLAVVAIPGYLVVAAGWGYIKWGLHIETVGRKVDAAKALFTERVADATRASERKLTEARSNVAALEIATGHPEATRSDSYGRGSGRRELDEAKEAVLRLERDRWWENEARRHLAWCEELASAGVTCSLPMRVSENKAKIIAWMAYWPASMAWTVLDDPLRRVLVAIYERIGGSLQSMSDRRFQNLDDTWKLPPGADR